MMGGLGFGMVAIGALMMLAFWVVVIGGAVWLIVTLTRGASAGTQHASSATQLAPGQTPLDVLKARYAKGEITKEQFEDMKRDLGA